MIVVDANVLLDALLDPVERGDAARAAITGHAVAGPEHLRVESFHVIRRLARTGVVVEDIGLRAIGRLRELPIESVPTAALLARMWELRHNLSGYDAAYVAAAEYLQVTLLTRDEGMLAIPDARGEIRRP